MPYVPWDQTMALGIEEVDEQHKGLLDILNRLHDGQQEEDTVRTCLADMRTYAFEHFTYEESLMSLEKYPDRDAHRRANQRFRERLEGFERSQHEGGVNVDYVLTYLKRWLVEHIMRVDREFGRYLGRC